MKITIESTEILAKFNGADVRLWKGKTEGGVEIQAYVTAIVVPRGETQEVERDLIEIESVIIDEQA